ncbi:hypothetical protein [Kingella denitrificans]|uniref:hypothetical protein n=1 Tax=Kingella denitrificans TaxID=502 RepID=UPI0011C02542|nr:hypothetical protein [Kingella denitrificans]QQB41615.1 hypothetical protein I6I17_09010 [Kingella denitrificans]
MPLRHSCRAVRSEAGKPRGAIQGRYPNEERRIPDPILIIKAACTPFPKVQAAFCAVYQIRCSQ